MQDNRSLNGSLTFSSTAYIFFVYNALGFGAIVDLKPRAMTFVRCPFDPWSLDDGVWLATPPRDNRKLPLATPEPWHGSPNFVIAFDFELQFAFGSVHYQPTP